VEIGSSSDEEPPKKKLITDYFATKQSRIHSNQQGIPNFLTRFNPVNRHANHTEGGDIITKQTEPTQPRLQTENAPVKRPTVYQTYTLAKKLEVVAYVKATSESLAAEHFKIPRTTISGWRGLDLMPKAKAKGKYKKGQHLAKGSGRQLSYPREVDENILCWILQRRDLHLPVQRGSICQYAKSLILPHNPHFSASVGWLQKFMIRHSLSLRRATSIQQKLPAQLQKKAEIFLQELTAIRKHHHFSDDRILNMDETPLWFDMPNNYTVAKKGDRQVRIRGTGSDKRRISVVLTATASGTMLKPLIIFKGKTARSIKGVQVPSTVAVAYQKKGYMGTMTMMLWIKQVLSKHTELRHHLLVFDAFSAHLTDEVTAMLAGKNIQTAVIPGGCTSKIQPLDVSLNKPFKAIVKQQWEQYMHENADTATTSNGKISPPTKSNLVGWVHEANNHLNGQKDAIVKAFKVCGISNALDGSENHFINCTKELVDITIPYGVDLDAEDSDDPFQSEDDSSDSETESDN
jgi:hypothetical protein